MKFYLLLFLLVGLSHLGRAQEVNRYMVFLADKESNSYSLERPQEFFTEKSLARREKFSIAITEQDLPVSEAYVQKIKEQGVPVYFRSRWLNAVLVEESPEKVNALKAIPFVQNIVFVAPGRKLGARTLAGTQHGSDVPQTQHQMLDVELMHQMGYTGQGKLIAVLDDGFMGVQSSNKFDHLFRNKQLVHTWDFVGNSPDVYRYDDHGTKALSTIAVVDSGTFIGVAPNAGFLLAVTEDVGSEYMIEEYNMLLGIEWADSLGADIISTSLGYTTFDDASMNHTHADLDGKTTVAARAMGWATERGILVVTSAGNSRQGAWGKIGTPADADNILAVGAVNNLGEIALFSSAGPTADNRIKPDVVAMGVGTKVVNRSGAYAQANGTSFSAPQIAGFAAAIWQAFPYLSNLQIRELILQSGSRFTTPDNDYGWGIPSFRLVTSLPEEVNTAFKLYPNPLQPAQHVLSLETAAGSAKTLNMQIKDATGRTLVAQSIALGAARKGVIDIGFLPPGLYYVQLEYENSRSVHKLLRL